MLILFTIGCSPSGTNRTDLLAQPDYPFAGTWVNTGATQLQEFELEDHNGPVKLSDFEGKYVVFYFGYTFCPDFCPITLHQMGQVKEALGARGEDLQVVMITVDPERDDPQTLHEYVSYFGSDYVGLSGSQEEIEAAAAPFGVFYELGERDPANDYYLVNHTTRTFLVGPQGHPLLSWRHDIPTDSIVSDLEYVMENFNFSN